MSPYILPQDSAADHVLSPSTTSFLQGPPMALGEKILPQSRSAL